MRLFITYTYSTFVAIVDNLLQLIFIINSAANFSNYTNEIDTFKSVFLFFFLNKNLSKMGLFITYTCSTFVAIFCRKAGCDKVLDF